MSDLERRLALLLVVTGCVSAIVPLAVGQTSEKSRPNSAHPPRSGEQIYRAACASCHGLDGKGVARPTVGFEVGLPDFTTCTFVTREPDADWRAVVHEGGPARSFNRLMPAFGDQLSDREIQATIDYIRGFCDNLSCWPRGELNFPRPLVTSKAFPEDEAVISTSVALEGAGEVLNKLIYETRIGARGTAEVVLPFGFLDYERRGWTGGLGDLVLATKWALWYSTPSGSIVSAALEGILPTGREDRGLGKGATILEPFIAFGQRLPAHAFAHVQVGAELSTNKEKSAHELFWRGVLGMSFAQGGFGRLWSPMVEVLGARELGAETKIQWDLVPQLQATISKRRHVIVGAGVRIPVSQMSERNAYYLMYLLWDWFDGSLVEGW